MDATPWILMASAGRCGLRRYPYVRLTLVSAMTLPEPSYVLVVDDEHVLRRTIRVALAASGFAVEEARHGQEALEAIRRHRFDLVLLDMNMPGIDGIETCRQIRSVAPSTGIIMLTVRDADEDKVRALEAGADDYMTKPVRFGELKARLGAVLRRVPADISEGQGILRIGDLRMDFEHRLLWKASKKISLSREEFDLLSLLMKSQDVTLTHLELVRGVWGPECDHEVERLRAYVRMLRRKIEDDPTMPQYLFTEARVGYRLRHLRSDSSRSSGNRRRRNRRKRLSAFDPGKLAGLRIDELREAIRANRVSFPSQVPTFKRHDRPDLHRKLVQLYFVLGWTCESIAERYGLVHQRIRQILTTWKRRAVQAGYIQYIPPSPRAPITPAPTQSVNGFGQKSFHVLA
jgi:two-component system, OmpR family, KDP operon response regulator KdpE